MGLFKAKDLASSVGELFRPTDACFYCAEPLHGDEWIFWGGNDESNTQIWMHPGCAKRLADNLNKDWEKFKRLHPEKLSV